MQIHTNFLSTVINDGNDQFENSLDILVIGDRDVPSANRGIQYFSTL